MCNVCKMKRLVKILLITIVILKTATTHEEEKISDKEVLADGVEQNIKSEALVNEKTAEDNENAAQNNSELGRSIGNGYEVEEQQTVQHADHHAAFRKRAKPLKSIFMGIYKNYKSTYLGNKTSEEYKKTLRDRLSAVTATLVSPKEEFETENETNENEDNTPIKDVTAANDDLEEQTTTEHEIRTTTTNPAVQDTTLPPLYSTKAKDVEALLASIIKKRRKRKRKNGNSTSSSSSSSEPPTRKRVKISTPADGKIPLTENFYRYNVGPGVNMSLDMSNDIVNVNLDADSLTEIMRGRWLSDNTEEGRGKKYDMITKVLPLFILPFLIQSAIVPFLVTKLKLLLVKSILVGKLAIFLLIVSAIKNSNKAPQAYEVAPSYWAGEPSRRSELASAASSAAYNGYRVEGKPTTWVN